LDATPTKSNPSETPEELKRSNNPTGPIAEILPTDLERLKESVPIFASQLTTTVGQLFPEEIHHPTQSKQSASARIAEGSQIKMKPPPVASLPPSAPSTRMLDKYAKSPYLNSGKKPESSPLVEEDSKLPARCTKTKPDTTQCISTTDSG
jgi:hypothetical protein